MIRFHSKTQPDVPRSGANDADPNGLVRSVHRAAQKIFEGAKGSHDWDHTVRVSRLCERIGPLEGADMTILLSAAYLHDIGRCHPDGSNGKICHARQGALMADPILARLPFSEENITEIKHAIVSHRFRGTEEPRTIEARVLFDADKLDAIGAVGVARAYQFAGELGARLHNPDMRVQESAPYSREDTGYREYVVKLSKIKDRILTPGGREIARERHAFMVAFFERFLAEYNGM
jgi:uncharacterized protein